MPSFYDVAVTLIDGQSTTLARYKGCVMLVVNVASRCGLTKQYRLLEALYKRSRKFEFVVLGFPANNFKEQEPGADEEIAHFCTSQYGITFPLFSKISVRGSDQHPLYRVLTEERPVSVGEASMRDRLAKFGYDPAPSGDVLWNFEKFLIGRDGVVLERFASNVEPDDLRLTDAIDRELLT